MSHTAFGFDYTMLTANDFRTLLYRVVDFGGDLSVAGAASAAGISQSRANSGSHMNVHVVGVAKAIAGAAITTPGYPLTTAASGFVVPAVSGSHVIGRYVQAGRIPGAAANSGDMVTGFFNFLSARRIGSNSGYL
jgi:hypothetical protein